MTSDSPTGMVAPRLRLMVLDEHFVVRVGIIAQLESEPDLEVVASVGTLEDAREQAIRGMLDLAVVESRLPDASGPEIVRTLREVRPGLKVVVLSAHAGEEEICRTLEAGANGYVLKSDPWLEVIATIRAAASGHRPLCRAAQAAVSVRSGRLGLTPRLEELLALLSEGMSNKQIAERLGLSLATIKEHNTRLFTRLRVENRTQAIAEGRRRGIVR